MPRDGDTQEPSDRVPKVGVYHMKAVGYVEFLVL